MAAQATDDTDRSDDDGLPLGRALPPTPGRIGFLAARAEAGAEAAGAALPTLIRAPGGMLTTIAPTGAGKGIGAVIPALLAHDGPVVVIDPKGENHAVTAAWRRRRGDRVVLLDPFGVTGNETDALNPLDLAALGGDAPEDAARAIVELLTGGAVSLKDPFWDNASGAFLSGLIATLLADRPAADRRLGWLRDLFGEHDLPLLVARLLDEDRVRNRDARQELSIFLNHPERETRPSVQSTAVQHLRLFGSEAVRRATDRSSFRLRDLVEGKPLALYLVLPPDKLGSHRALLRLWLGTILRALATRRRLPAKPTLLLVDEAAQLGRLEPLLQAVTLMRGFGLRVWTFWQDLSQLQALYPAEWPALLNASAVLQLFGVRNWRMAEEYAALAGLPDPGALLDLGPEGQVLVLEGQRPLLARRLDYRREPGFAGRFAPNPYHAPPPPARRARRERSTAETAAAQRAG